MWTGRTTCGGRGPVLSASKFYKYYAFKRSHIPVLFTIFQVAKASKALIEHLPWLTDPPPF